MTNNFDSAKVYIVYSDKTDKVFVGLTTEKYLSNKLGAFRKAYKKYNQTKSGYNEVFKIVQYDDCKITQFDSCSYSNVQEKNEWLNHYIDLLTPFAINTRKQTKTTPHRNEYMKQLMRAKTATKKFNEECNRLMTIQL